MTAVREVVEGCLEAGVEVLTLFAFSQENWQRPADEIDALMSLLEEYIAREARRAARARRPRPDPRRAGPARPTSARGAVERIDGGDRAAATALALNLCISYSSRAEIARAARRLAEEVGRGPARSRREIDEEARRAPALHRAVARSRPADPHLGRDADLQFPALAARLRRAVRDAVLWPDFTRRHLFEAILEFQRRDRRFGRVSA